MNIGNKIRIKRQELGLTQTELGKMIGVSDSVVAKYENNKVKNLKRETIQKLSDIFNVSPAYFFDVDTIKLHDKDVTMTRIPIYERISCGNGLFVDNDIVNYLYINNDIVYDNKDYFAQYVQGDSMIDVGINDNDLCIFEISETIDNNQIGCFVIDENIVTCKKYRKTKDVIYLFPCNSKYEPIIITPENEYFRVIGILKKVIKSY